MDKIYNKEFIQKGNIGYKSHFKFVGAKGLNPDPWV